MGALNSLDHGYYVRTRVRYRVGYRVFSASGWMTITLSDGLTFPTHYLPCCPLFHPLMLQCVLRTLYMQASSCFVYRGYYHSLDGTFDGWTVA